MNKGFHVGTLVFALLVAVCSCALSEDGLVLHYDFSEGSGTVLHDLSGSKTDGTIIGPPEWVRTGKGDALRFGGETYIDCGTASTFGAEERGTVEMWCNLDAYQGGLLSRSLSGSWTDERLILVFYTYVAMCDHLVMTTADGLAADVTTLKVRPTLGRWTHYVLTFDKSTVSLYVNGVRVQSFPKRISPKIKDVPLRIGFGEGLGISYMKGMLDEVRLYNRSLSEREVIDHFKAKASLMGFDNSQIGSLHDGEIPFQVDIFPYADKPQITLDVDLYGCWPLPQNTQLVAELREADGTSVVQRQTLHLTYPSKRISFDMKGVPEGGYQALVVLRNASGRKEAPPSAIRFTWPRLQSPVSPGSGARVLNNFVIELLDKPFESMPSREIAFMNPYEGWVFFSSTVNGNGKASITLDGDTSQSPIISGTSEAMRHLTMGKHTLRIRCEEKASIKRLMIRAVPELIYCQYRSDPILRSLGKYDWDFLQKHYLPNLNCIISHETVEAKEKEHFEEWKGQGRRWIFMCQVPGYDAPPYTAEDSYKYWSGQAGYHDPLADGIIMDEFGGASTRDIYHTWADAVDRLYQDGSLTGKVFYPFLTDRPLYEGKSTRRFADTVMKHGGRLVPEHYVSEQSTPELMDATFDELREEVLGWQKIRPDATRHIIPALGYMMMPGETENCNPAVDYKVAMDRQMYLLANDPAYRGLYGVMWYKSCYADEETARWSSRLFRHYCIEGKTNLLSDQLGFTYRLQHLKNPDFDEGLSDWQISPAEKGSISAGRMDGMVALQGRMVKPAMGDHFLITRRSALHPNEFSQVIKGLRPGKLYSMKMYTIDRRDALNPQPNKRNTPLSIRIDNAEILGEHSFDEIVRNFNYHWRVFRTKGSHARLTVSDWPTPTAPGGESGQEILYNFIEIQPYFSASDF